jgi:hypothetical protein
MRIEIDGLKLEWEGDSLWISWNKMDHKKLYKSDVAKLRKFLAKKAKSK